MRKKGFKGSSVLLFGRSLGTALAIDIASREECLGVILEAAFTSTDDMMRRYFPFLSLPPQATVKYDSLSIIDRIRSPVLFLHGQWDQTIPVYMARRLFDKAHSPKEFHEIAGADHNDTYLVGGVEYFAVLQKFFILCLNHLAEGTP